MPRPPMGALLDALGFHAQTKLSAPGSTMKFSPRPLTRRTKGQFRPSSNNKMASWFFEDCLGRRLKSNSAIAAAPTVRPPGPSRAVRKPLRLFKPLKRHR